MYVLGCLPDAMTVQDTCPKTIDGVLDRYVVVN
jgi:hypothetical protein